MHPFSILTLGIFVAGYITARWDLVTRLYELAIFAADHGVVVSPAGLLFSLSVFLTIYRPEQPADSFFSHWSSSFLSCLSNVLQHARQTM